MKVSEDLFHLIKSLDKQEKRYFKLQMNSIAGNLKQNLLDLFDAMDKQTDYDEDKIKKKFKDRPFVKQLHVAKNRLYKAVLKSLDAYYAEQSTDRQINRMIHESEILFDKGLRTQGKKMLQKAKKKALEEEQFLYMLQIIQLEVQFFGEQHNIEQLRKHSSEGYQIGLKIIDRYRNFMELNMMRSKVVEYISRRNAGKIKEELEKLFSPAEKLLLASEQNALSFVALTRQLVINSVYSRLAGEFEKSYEYRLRLVEVMENNKKKLRTHAKAYISALHNLLGIQVELEMYDGALVTLVKLEELRQGASFKLTEKRSLEILLPVVIGRSSIYIDTNNFDAALDYVEKIKLVLEEYGEIITVSYRLILKYNIAFIYFCCAQHQEATAWFYDLLTSEDSNAREDIHSYSRILNLLSYYDLGNQGLFDSVFKSTYRHFKNRESTYKHEVLIIKYIRKAINLYDKSELSAHFKSLHTELTDLLNDPDESEGIRQMKLLSWCQSKIDNCKMVEILERDKKPLAALD